MMAFVSSFLGRSKFTFSASTLMISSPTRKKHYDVAIIGGGIVGLASAYQLSLMKPQPSIVLVEKEKDVGMEQSSHNSGVLHAGIYYQPGSDRARLCVSGLQKMYSFLQTHKIPYQKCGKLIVALDDSEVPYLEELFKRATQNKCPNIRLIYSKEEIKTIEPYCEGIAAIHSPETGIVNFGDVCSKLKELIQENGVEVICNYHADAFQLQENGNTVFQNRNEPSEKIESKFLITCSGHESDRIAQQCGLTRSPSVIPIRGKWNVIKPEYGHLVKGNIYPVPNPKLPMLGVHFTKKVGSDEIWSGPNSVIAFSRKGYKLTDINLKDLWETLNHVGFYRLLKLHWKSGFFEVIHELFFGLQLAKMQKYIPELTRNHFEKEERSGVRAAVVQPSGEIVHDFLFETHPQKTQLHVRNAPSPAATSSFAIAEEIILKAQKEMPGFPCKKE